MKRLLKAILGGSLITIVVFIAVIVIDLFGGDSEHELLLRTPIAWIFFWPQYFIDDGYHSRDALHVLELSFLTNIAVYSLMTYAVLWWRWAKPKLL